MSVCLCQRRGWFSARNAELTEMKLGVQITWVTRVLWTVLWDNCAGLVYLNLFNASCL